MIGEARVLMVKRNREMKIEDWLLKTTCLALLTRGAKGERLRASKCERLRAYLYKSLANYSGITRVSQVSQGSVADPTSDVKCQVPTPLQTKRGV